MKRDFKNGDLRLSHIDNEVNLIGWVNKRRNFGSLVFIDLRDYTGITQLVFDEKISSEIKDVRSEYILNVKGVVKERKDKNPNMKTGDIEVIVSSVDIINTANTLPISISDKSDSLEETRLKFRYLDLRREVLQKNIRLRHKVSMLIREKLDSKGFTEIETPILGKSTPEGARDYLVPSRINKGSFYALPQSPQLYKQLLMIGGFDKYFQIARCFRDEDLRADRQPEFTQIDIEMSFVEERDVYDVVEDLMKDIFKKIKNIDIKDFKYIPYKECMDTYGSDKPDLRFDLKLKDISYVFKETEFKIFKEALDLNKFIKCIKVNASLSRKEIDKLQDFLKSYHNVKALSYLKYNNNELSGSIFKVLNDNEKEVIIKDLELVENDIIFIIADEKDTVNNALGALRSKLAHDLNLIDKSRYEFLWVTDFPMFEYSKEEERWVAAHHPFTSIKKEDIDKLKSDPGNCCSRAYDLVLNGYELLSGSIRIFDQDLQAKVFDAIGLDEKQAYDKFGYFLEAFKYGAPPHGGVGIGLERLIMILADTDNIRDVVAFPKTSNASDLMSNAPSKVDEKQLKDLEINILKK